MTGKDALKLALTSTADTIGMYLGDLSDADLTVRPVPAANNIAWQLGHLIGAESYLMQPVPGASYPEVPVKLSDYSKETSTSAPAGGFLTKAQYMDAFKKVRAATIATVDRLTDADLDKPNTGTMAKFAPTIAALIMLVSNHTLMHFGQFTVTRRALGKPVVF